MVTGDNMVHTYHNYISQFYLLFAKTVCFSEQIIFLLKLKISLFQFNSQKLNIFLSQFLDLLKVLPNLHLVYYWDIFFKIINDIFIIICIIDYSFNRVRPR